MKGLATLLATTLLPIAAQGITLGDIAERLASTACYADSCSYEVLLPNLSEPVIYSIKLQSTKAGAGDTLSPCRYMIDWSLKTPTGTSDGFSAYFDGSHFRYRDERLQEYHAQWNPETFAPGGERRQGVHYNVQFADLLPAFLAERFAEMATDTSYVYTITDHARLDGRNAIALKGKRRFHGYDSTEFEYLLDPSTCLPLRISLENNPGQLSEQSVTVRYSGVPVLNSECSIDLPTLSRRHSDAFEKYRESSFSLQSLPGQRLPEISAPTTTGERYFHPRGSEFAAPTVIVFLETKIGSTPDVIKAVRQAVDFMPVQTDVIWAFLDHRADDIDSILPRPRPGEHILMNAYAPARACGVGAVTPVLVFVRPDGRVSDISIGVNQDLSSIVIQKVGLAAGN